MKTTIDDLIRRYDAEPAARLTADEQACADQLFAQITATPLPSASRPTRAAAARGATRRRPARGPLLVAGAAAAAAVIALGAGSPLLERAIHRVTGQTSATGMTFTDVADWTPLPRHPSVTSPAVERTASACLADLGVDDSAAASAQVSNVDQRGAVTTLVATDPATGKRTWCLADDHGVVLSQLIDSPSMPLPPIADGAVNVQSQDGHGWGAEAISLSYGQAGRDVTAVTLTTAAGEAISATVDHGLWTLWWPPRDTATDDLGDGTLTWTTAGGHTRTAPVAALYANG